MQISTLVKIQNSATAILDYYDTTGNVPTREFALENGLLKVGKTTITRLLGGWNAFLELLDIPVGRMHKWDTFETACTMCGDTIIKTKGDLLRSISGNFFCSKSCAAKYNNKHYAPKRGAAHHPCPLCGKHMGKYGYQKRICNECKKEEKGAELKQPIKNLIYSNDANRYNHIRGRARSFYFTYAPKICLICGYPHHVQVCHIIAISDFDESTPLGVVNGQENLIGLCPNCHWELDHKLLAIGLIL